jgi:hypothetical protein
MGTPFSAINKYVHHNMTYVLQKVVCAKHTKPNITCLIPIITMNLMMKVVFPIGGGQVLQELYYSILIYIFACTDLLLYLSCHVI